MQSTAAPVGQLVACACGRASHSLVRRDAESATDRPDAIPAFEIHVVYAVLRTAPTASRERVPEIATDAASVDLGGGTEPDPMLTRCRAFDAAGFLSGSR